MQYTAIATRSITVGAGQLADYSPESLAAGEVVFFQSWTSSIGILKTNAAWNPATRTLSTASPINTECYGACLNRYFVQNVLDAKLMAPGTFSLDDRDVSNRTIMYKPLPGETVAPGDLAVGNISEVLVTASTDGSSKPGFVTMRGITFSHTASALSYCINSGCNGQSASSGQTATVHLTNATNFEFFNCTVSETGHYGVWVDQGSSDVSVSHCNFTSLGAGGIRIGAARSGVAPDLTQQVQRATVSDCTVSNTGAVVMAGAGVLSQQASDVLITHNNIGNLLYTGVSAGWTWGYAPTSVHNVTVSFNDIHDIFQGELSDGGCVYTLGIQPGSLVDNNRCWNVHSAGYGGWGTYTDEGSSFITFSNNLIYNTKSAGHHQHYGENNTIENNIIAFPGKWPCDGVPGCDNAGLRSSQHPPGSGGGGPFSSFSFLRNIMLLDQLYSPPMYTTIPTGLKNDTLNGNTYWSLTNHSNLLFGPSQDPMSFSAWQQSGKDVDSVVADPQFVDPINLNFDLQPTSPALKLGFKPIDFSSNGPRPMA